ncbi:MAG: hypothetical protein IKK36_07870 [Bacteroidales bacterium]|nr:hypothetical protein [Bacteroidales bacterium]
MYKRLEQLLNDLEKMNPKPFIGYGNPDAKILIVGKECTAEEGSDNWKKFYAPNFNQWKKSFEGHGFDFKSGIEPYDFEHGNFHPINPYYRLENKKQSKNKEVGRPSATYYYYQRLIDKIRAWNGKEYKKSDYIDFFNDCFITELNNICRPNDSGLKKPEHEKIEESIRKRFNWMRKTNFFNQFKVVILACGPYSGAIKKDEKLCTELFGNAHIVYCHQLSYWDKNLDNEIPNIQKTLRNEQ